MGKWLLLVLMIVSNTVFAKDVIVSSVYDGDTFYFIIPEHPPAFKKMGVRIKGIDTPEMPSSNYSNTGKLGRSKCKKEAELAIEAKQFLLTLLKKNSMNATLKNIEPDKFGERILANVFVGNQDVANLMIQNKYAVQYNGEKKTFSWCE